MNRIELVSILEREQINPRFYSVYGLTKPPIAEQCVLGREGDKWVVYYFERGEKSGLKLFDTEDEACRYFLDWVLRITGLRLKGQ